MDFVAVPSYHVELNLGGWKDSFLKTNIYLAIHNCLVLIIHDFVVSSPDSRQSVSILRPWVSLRSTCQVWHGTLFLKEAHSQVGKLGKFFHSLAVVFFYLLGSHHCPCCFFGWMKASFTLCFPVSGAAYLTESLCTWEYHRCTLLPVEE